MNDVRTVLAQAWNRLHQVGKNYDLKNQLSPVALDEFIAKLDEIERLVHEARLRAAGYSTEVVFAVAKEKSPGEYTAFTQGPCADMEALLGSTAEDGEILVKITMKDGQPQYEELKGYLDGRWIDV